MSCDQQLMRESVGLFLERISLLVKGQHDSNFEPEKKKEAFIYLFFKCSVLYGAW